MSKLLNMLADQEKDERILNIKQRISFEYSTLIIAFFLIMFMWLVFDYIYVFINSATLRHSFIILSLILTVCVAYAYSKMLKRLDNIWKTKNFCE